MKIDKKILFSVLLVLVMLCVISTASAEDTIDENLTATDNEVVVDEKLSVEKTVERGACGNRYRSAI